MLKIKKILKEADMKSGVIVALAIGLVIISLFAGNEGAIFGNITKKEEVNINELLLNIKDNYTLSITKTKGLEETNYKYITDNNIDEYDINDEVYLVYKNKTYKVNTETFKIKKTDKIDIIDDPYTNIKLIQNTLSHCEYEYVNDTNSSCKISIKDYMNEYKKIYNIDNPTIDQNININVSYYSTKIHSITIDYTTVDSLINGGVEELKYKIVIDNIDKNNNSELIEYYKDSFK